MSFPMKSLALLPLFVVPLFAEDTFEGVQRIVAIGDIHGDYGRFVELLRSAQVVDRNNAWAGGATHLVLTGDFLDRGPAPRPVMDLLIELEPQADAGPTSCVWTGARKSGGNGSGNGLLTKVESIIPLRTRKARRSTVSVERRLRPVASVT